MPYAYCMHSKVYALTKKKYTCKQFQISKYIHWSSGEKKQLNIHSSYKTYGYQKGVWTYLYLLPVLYYIWCQCSFVYCYGYLAYKSGHFKWWIASFLRQYKLSVIELRWTMPLVSSQVLRQKTSGIMMLNLYWLCDLFSHSRMHSPHKQNYHH